MTAPEPYTIHEPSPNQLTLNAEQRTTREGNAQTVINLLFQRRDNNLDENIQFVTKPVNWFQSVGFFFCVPCFFKFLSFSITKRNLSVLLFL